MKNRVRAYVPHHTCRGLSATGIMRIVADAVTDGISEADEGNGVTLTIWIGRGRRNAMMEIRGILDRAWAGGPLMVTTWSGERFRLAPDCDIDDLVTGNRVVGHVERLVSGPLPVVGHKLHCLGTAANGQPRHPLYVPAVTRPVEWEGGK